MFALADYAAGFERRAVEDDMATETGNTDRYECLLDPLDHYVVWDNATNLPGMMGDEILAFATRVEAIAAIDLLHQATAAEVQLSSSVTRAAGHRR
jgi:hypothetical protein